MYYCVRLLFCQMEVHSNVHVLWWHNYVSSYTSFPAIGSLCHYVMIEYLDRKFSSNILECYDPMQSRTPNSWFNAQPSLVLVANNHFFIHHHCKFVSKFVIAHIHKISITTNSFLLRVHLVHNFTVSFS